jgi:hypothetical protein
VTHPQEYIWTILKSCWQSSRANRRSIAFTPRWQGKILEGPAQVRAALAQRPAGRTTAHLVQNLVIDVQTATTASASYMTLVYRVDRDGPSQAPAPLGQAALIALNSDRLARDANGEWKMLEKRSVQKFVA